MVEKNCPDCVVNGEYCFKDEVDRIVSGMEPTDNEKTLFNSAAETHDKIKKEREEARKKLCHNINNIDPDYPGKKLL